MYVAVTSTGADLDAPVSPIFGRCPAFVFVNTTSMSFEAQPNPATGASGGAGVQAAQYVVDRGAQAVLAGNVGPNAFDVFQAAGIPVYLIREGSVRRAVEALQADRLLQADRANVRAHAGIRRGGRGQRGTSRVGGRSRVHDHRIEKTEKET